MAQHIVAIGGASFEVGTPDMALYRFLAELSGKETPKACFLPTASGEPAQYVEDFRARFGEIGCESTWLSFFFPHTADMRSFLLEQDIVYVGGGNTKSMLALWREWGIDRILREAWQSGTVLAGLSAGAICWFEQGITDSIPGPLTPIGCLGYLPGSCCPHYDSEPERQPSYTRLIDSGKLKPGYAAYDHVGLVFEDGEFTEAVGSVEGARAFFVSPEREEEIGVSGLK